MSCRVASTVVEKTGPVSIVLWKGTQTRSGVVIYLKQRRLAQCVLNNTHAGAVTGTESGDEANPLVGIERDEGIKQQTEG